MQVVKKIEKAFRKLSLKHHPDKNKNPESTAKFQEINEAEQKLLPQSGGNAIEYLFVNKEMKLFYKHYFIILLMTAIVKK